ncbi:MAG: hypothetical protein JJU46_06350 [Balneolaceae bacterium]|nr:hypothetical protein [Balneolaceae bacterium]MCH8548182.1 hypothetical protein [Balneolaceae bacterium]
MPDEISSTKNAQIEKNMKQTSYLLASLFVVFGLFSLSFHDLVHDHSEDSAHHHQSNLPFDFGNDDDCIYCLVNTDNPADYRSTWVVDNNQGFYISGLDSSLIIPAPSFAHFALRAPPIRA